MRTNHSGVTENAEFKIDLEKYEQNHDHIFRKDICPCEECVKMQTNEDEKFVILYTDKWGRYHDKKCIGGEPSSNNGWIYTAYAKKLGLPIDTDKLQECFLLCSEIDYSGIDRSPGKHEPPISRDEIIGIISLGLLSINWLKKYSWSFSPYTIPPFNPLKTLAAAWRLRSAHRNALWQDGGEPHLFRFAFSVPLQDRAFMLRTSGRCVPMIYRLIAWIDKRLPAKGDSSKLLRFLKYDQMPSLEVWERYFGKNHPFTQKIIMDAQMEINIAALRFMVSK